MGQVTVVTSGKGGAGKSTVTAGLGCALADHGQRVLLVDDVVTTGSTADACASVLRDRGAEDVILLTFAAASHEKSH